jgi:hypothetical protein
MSEVTVEWIAMLLFAVLFLGAILGEIFWLIRGGSTTLGRATAFVLLTDLLSLCIGSVIVFIIFGIMLMLTFGPAGRGSDTPESVYWAILTFALICPPVLLFALKRLLLWIFKIKSGKTAWIYSFLSSVLILLVVMVPPPLVYFLFVKFLK